MFARIVCHFNGLGFGKKTTGNIVHYYKSVSKCLRDECYLGWKNISTLDVVGLVGSSKGCVSTTSDFLDSGTCYKTIEFVHYFSFLNRNCSSIMRQIWIVTIMISKYSSPHKNTLDRSYVNQWGTTLSWFFPAILAALTFILVYSKALSR